MIASAASQEGCSTGGSACRDVVAKCLQLRVGHLSAQVLCHQVRWVGFGADFHHTQLPLEDSLLYPEVLDLDMPRLSDTLGCTMPMAADASVHTV